DPVRVEQVVANLLHNASKFTPVGGNISLTVSREKSEDGGGGREMAVVRVQDDGVGLSAEMLPQIFDLFVQGDQSLGRPGGGLGIGLTLVRRLVELHGGTVEAKSAGPGKGSLFTVRLPLGAPPEQGDGAGAAEGEEPTVQARSRRILVVDDIPDSADSLSMLL